jgi:hypothetical protein
LFRADHLQEAADEWIGRRCGEIDPPWSECVSTLRRCRPPGQFLSRNRAANHSDLTAAYISPKTL